MKIKYFPVEVGIFQREIWIYLRTVSGRVSEKFLSVTRLDGYRVSEKHQVRNF